MAPRSGMVVLLIALGACLAPTAAASSGAAPLVDHLAALSGRLVAQGGWGGSTGGGDAQRGVLAGALVNGSYTAGSGINQYDPAANPEGVPVGLGSGNALTGSADNVAVGSVNYMFAQAYTNATGCPDAGDPADGFTAVQALTIAPSVDVVVSITVIARNAGTCELPAATATLKSRALVGCTVTPWNLTGQLGNSEAPYPMPVTASIACDTLTIKYARSPAVLGFPNVLGWGAAWNLTCPPTPETCSANSNSTCCDPDTGCPKPAGSVCRPSEGQCTSELVCDGSSVECTGTGSSSTSGFHCWVDGVIKHVHEKIDGIKQFFGNLAKWHN